MDFLLLLLLSVPLILIRIGDFVRQLAILLLRAIISAYNYSRNSIRRSIKWFKSVTVSPPNLPAYTPVSRKKKVAYPSKVRTPARWPTVFGNLFRLYRDCIINALGTFIPRIKIGKIRYPKIYLPRSAPAIYYFKNQLRKIRNKLTPAPTPAHPYTIYPVPLKIAWQLKSFFAGIVLTILFLGIPFTFYQWVSSLPNPHLLSNRDIEVATKIFDRSGTLLYEIYADQNRTPLTVDQFPDYVKQATIAIEDRNFYTHQGFSIRGILRAARENIVSGQVQGGSTITQQLIKSALLTPEISLSRKIREIILAFWAERIYTKNQILEMYLNQVPYGGTAWGIEAASQTYFGKSVQDITLAQAALLAGLPAAPTEYSPFGSSPQKAVERQREVLRRMTEDHYITSTQADQAMLESLHFITPHIGIRAPHFVMYVKDILEKKYGPRLVERGGLRVTTTLDLNLQEKAEEIVRTQVDNLTGLKVGNGAALVTNPKTGEILAMVGSRNYFDIGHDGNVNVTTSLRQPGSSIKVVNYTAALENGFTAATIIDDSPVAYKIAGSPTYAPVNYDGRYHGPTPLRYALGNSYNIPAVKVLNKIGVKTMIDKGKLMGITSWADESRYGLSLTLGGGDVTMLNMAEVFGTLANSGRRLNLNPVLEVTDYTGKIREKLPEKSAITATSPEVAWIISNILSDNAARTSAFGPNSSLVIAGKTVSVKTGTSNEKRDNWTIGFTPSVVTAVWVGNNDNSPMDPLLTSGITGAAPIWHDIMTEILKNKTDEIPSTPANIVAIPCYNNRTEYFVRGTQPSEGRCATLPSPSPTPKS